MKLALSAAGFLAACVAVVAILYISLPPTTRSVKGQVVFVYWYEEGGPPQELGIRTDDPVFPGCLLKNPYREPVNLGMSAEFEFEPWSHSGCVGTLRRVK